MFLELEKVYITKLKTVLQSNWLYVLLFIVLISFLFVKINFCDKKVCLMLVIVILLWKYEIIN